MSFDALERGADEVLDFSADLAHSFPFMLNLRAAPSHRIPAIEKTPSPNPMSSPSR